MNLRINSKIILLFGLAILISFIPDQWPSFFGDTLCKGNILENDFQGCPNEGHRHNPTFHWGYRHFLFFMMGLCLFVLQIIDIFKDISKTYDN